MVNGELHHLGQLTFRGQFGPRAKLAVFDHAQNPGRNIL